jgi:hypothetical protein
MARGSAWKRTRTQVLHLTIFFFLIILLIAPPTATCVALAAGFAFLLVAGALVLPATVPDRQGDHVDAPHGLMRIVAFVHQFAGFTSALQRVVLSYNVEACAGMHVRRERILDEPEVLVVGRATRRGAHAACNHRRCRSRCAAARAGSI